MINLQIEDQSQKDLDIVYSSQRKITGDFMV